MIGKQEADRIVAEIAEKLSDSAATILASANPRGAIKYCLTWDLSQELRGLVEYVRGEFSRYYITDLGRQVAAKRSEIDSEKTRI